MFEIKHIEKRYAPGAKNILDDISFRIEKGEIIGVLGENGAGKTTLIKSMLKLLELDQGTIEYCGCNIAKIPNRHFYKVAASVLEGNRNLYWYLSGYENIMYFASLKQLKKKEIQEDATYYLKKFDLYNDKDKCVGEYSRGMQQKLSIIIALLGNPEILFLDEPTLGLDVKTKKQVIETLRQLAVENHVTIFITSHQLDVIDLLVDRLLVLKNGKIWYEGNPYAFKEAYSQNKYTITVVGEVSDVLKQYEYTKVDKLIHICLRETDSDDVFFVLRQLRDSGYEIVSFRKDTSDLEEIMLCFMEREGEKE